jgi:uncharacterized protein YcnI
VLLAAAAMLLPLTPASAHVKVRAQTPPVAGGYATLTFSVPTESDSASTVRVAVALPSDRPFSSVRVQPHPGWHATLTRTHFDKPVAVGSMRLTDAVTKVMWTAQPGHAIGPNEFDEFSLSVGPLPTAGQLTLPVVQRYSDGSVVRWSAPATPGADEPEHPSPAVTVLATDPAAGGDPTGVSRLDVAAVVLGGVALLVAVAAVVRARPRKQAA